MASNGLPHPKLAFLGPVGTYSHQAAYERFADCVDYHARKTIADVFYSVDATFSLGLLPQENSIFGSVTETYDLLRSLEVGKTKWIRGSVTLPVQHSLLVRRGQTLANIKRILSHEQALGQCRQFIKAHCPNASLVSVASTAAAAEALSHDPDAIDSAAICSKFCMRLFPGLEVLHEGIQNENHNFTRFYILANHPTGDLPVPLRDTQSHALLRVHVGRGSVERDAITITELISALRLPATRIDRRPTAEPEHFESVYMIELVNRPEPEVRSAGDARLREWADEVQEGVERIVAAGGSATVLGIW
ncbi:PDT-domain-containing protein [Amylostereum chailletii]|nr:PDT-domain-containing protein [Amylostereum chailletii]